MPPLSQLALVLAVAALPVSELRGAIPLALLRFEFDPWLAYGAGVLGNLLPVPFLLLGLERLIAWAPRVPLLRDGVRWWTARTRRKHSKAFERFGALALVLFVAVPLPVTGAWTGSLAAVLFGVPLRWSALLIALGVLLAGVVVSLATLVGAGLFQAPGP